MTTINLYSLIILFMILFGLITMGAAETSVSQSSSSSVNQQASVSGGDATVTQESTVRAETDDGVFEQQATLEAEKKDGEPAVINRNIERDITGFNNSSVQFDVDQDVSETANGLTTSQEAEANIATENSDMSAETSETAQAGLIDNEDAAAGANTLPETERVDSESRSNIVVQFVVNIREVIDRLIGWV